MSTDQACWKHSSGSRRGKEREGWSYSAPSRDANRDSSPMEEVLGQVRVNHEDLFEWWLYPARTRTDWPVRHLDQGIAPTLEAARAIIEGAWVVAERM